MQQKDIELFLSLVQTRNITKTAELMYIAQSAVSTRLKHLEEEIGYPLFFRAKGHRTIELTRQGLAFVAIAERWRNLFEETSLLQTTVRHSLHIASNESTYYSYLLPFVKQFFHAHGDCHIYLEICDSNIIYTMLEHNLIDYGFVAYESYRTGIQCSLLQEDELRILRDKKSGGPSTIHPSSLDPAKEIRFMGGNFSDVDVWRQTWFGTADVCRLETNSGLSIVDLVRDSDFWALCPRPFAERVAAAGDLDVCRISPGPLRWRTYIITRAGQQEEKLTINRLFEQELREFIARSQKYRN